ncbi:SanA/YdcF family protein [Actinocorallia longicatena]
MRHIARIIRSPRLWIPLGLGAVLVLTPTGWAYARSAGHVQDVEHVKTTEVALVLGAGIYPDGLPTPFLAGRLDTAVRLYSLGKVRAILVSGDNSRKSYDEPEVMKNYLVSRGVPAEKIVLDYAGFDTWDSCVRAGKVFGVKSVTVVSQDFHMARAVALCRQAGLSAEGVGNSQKDRARTLYGYAREIPATLKAMNDVLLDNDPRFLGPKEPGIEKALATG